MLMKTGGCRSQRPAPPTFCTSLIMLITVYTDDDDDDNDDDDNEDGDDEDSQVRVEGHFGLLAGRNMSSEGRFSSIYIVSNGNFPLSSPLFCHCGLNDQVHNMGRWGAARIG